MISNDFNCFLLLLMVIVSSCIGRLSLRKSKYTGWYEKFFDISKLTYLIQNSIIFFTAALFCLLLLAVSPAPLQHDLRILGAMLLLFLVIVFFFFCLQQLLSLPRRFFRWAKRKKRSAPPGANDPSPDTNDPSPGPSSSPEYPTPHSILLRFLSFFTFALSFCTILLLVLFLAADHTGSAQTPLTFLELLRSRGHGAITAYHFYLLFPSFLLVLTSSTGALLAATGIDYGQPCATDRNQTAQRKLNELSSRIRNR